MAFDEDMIDKIWNKGVVVKGYNPDLYRQDSCGAWMMRSEYGSADNILGWVIDHVYPISKGGADDLINLRPLQYQNNISKSDFYPVYTAAVIAKDSKNIESKSEFTVNDDLQSKLSEIYAIKK